MESTTQSRERFAALVEQAEREILANPAAYKMKLMMLAMLGYAVIFGVLFTLIAIIGGLTWAAFASTALLILLVKKKIIFVLLFLAWGLLKALWVKIEAPQGFELSRAAFPVFYADLDHLSKQLDAPRIHQVILTEEYNAGVQQTPRLGILGWHKNTLIIGLELLLGMTRDQAKAVLAHELGHLSGNHSRFNAWIYRVRRSWYDIMSAFEQADNFGARVMRRFFFWYAPTFNAYSFALARQNEYEADAVSAQLTSPDNVATALVNSHALSPLMSEFFWKPYFKQADISEHIEQPPFQRMVEYLKSATIPEEALQHQLNKILKVATDHGDTHPALRDRLAALQIAAQLPAPVTENAALYWFGDHYPDIIQAFDERWVAHHGDAWSQHFHHTTGLKQTLLQLQHSNPAELTQDQAWQLATLTEQFYTAGLSIVCYEEYKTRFPEDINVCLALGNLYLLSNDERGVALLKQAAQKPELKIAACESLYHYYLEQDEKDVALQWLIEAEAQEDINRAADAERHHLTAKDTMLPAQITEEQREYLRESTQSIKGIKEVWIAQKQVRHYADHPVYVIAYTKGWFKSESKLNQEIISRVDIPHSFFVLCKNGDYKALAKKATKVGEKIW